jgi:hypothetical protein
MELASIGPQFGRRREVQCRFEKCVPGGLLPQPSAYVLIPPAYVLIPRAQVSLPSASKNVSQVACYRNPIFPVLPLSAHRFHCVKDPKNCHFWGNKGYPFPKVKIFSRKALYGFPSEKDPKRCRFHRVVFIESAKSPHLRLRCCLRLPGRPGGR